MSTEYRLTFTFIAVFPFIFLCAFTSVIQPYTWLACATVLAWSTVAWIWEEIRNTSYNVVCMGHCITTNTAVLLGAWQFFP